MFAIILQAFFTLARDIKLKMDKKLVSSIVKQYYEEVACGVVNIAKSFNSLQSLVFFVHRNNQAHKLPTQSRSRNSLNNQKGFSDVRYCRIRKKLP